MSNTSFTADRDGPRTGSSRARGRYQYPRAIGRHDTAATKHPIWNVAAIDRKAPNLVRNDVSSVFGAFADPGDDRTT